MHRLADDAIAVTLAELDPAAPQDVFIRRGIVRASSST